MRISCAIVSYNNGSFLSEAMTSVLKQTRPVDEIIVADDASTDRSRQLIEGFSHRFTRIRPVFRERNLGVSANRDLAIREAHGDFVTWLDGDDLFLPTKIEAEARALGHRRNVIAYSDVRVIDRPKNRFRTAELADFSQVTPSQRVRWLLKRDRDSPRSMLIPRDAHLRVGGYNHDLSTYEDWDYIMRLAARPLSWIHSQTEGLVHHQRGGLSKQGSIAHMRDELRVLRLNRELARRHVGFPLLLSTAGRVVLMRSKWWLLSWTSQDN